MSTRPKCEQETILRWDRASDQAMFWTAAPAEARRWQRLGYPVIRESGGWRAMVPRKAVSLRRFSTLTRPPRPEAGRRGFGSKVATGPGILEAVGVGVARAASTRAG